MKTAIDPGQPLEPVLAPAGPIAGTELDADLPPPPAVEPERYKIDWYYTTSIVTMHLLGLLVFVPWLFSWTGVVLLVLGIYFYGGVGINMCYHRLLTHKSFKCPRWLERFMVLVAACCLEDSPGRWVTTHRLHHNESDQPPDPHSPRVSFFWSHMGWLLVRNTDVQNITTFDRYSRDIMSDPFYMRLERGLLWFWIYQMHALAYLLIGTVAGWFLTGTLIGAAQFGLSVLVWGVFARTVAVWHITWSVNSLSHMFGYRNYETNEGSRNNWLVAFLTSGEGWHNNHHGDPASATTCHRWWEIDGIYWGIKALEMVGLAWDVVPPRSKRRSSR
jgi:stearoyl-CoA desaturase (delta-9 desaturase)